MKYLIVILLLVLTGCQAAEPKREYPERPLGTICYLGDDAERVVVKLESKSENIYVVFLDLPFKEALSLYVDQRLLTCEGEE